MPSYDYRCNQCGRALTLYYKTYADYDAATHTCPHCGSVDLTRLISRVAIARPPRDLANLSSTEMLSVLEGGDSREMGELFRQVGETIPGGMDTQFNDVAKRLLQGDRPEHIEADLRAASDPGESSSPPAAAPAAGGDS
jgi:putative FmdB family regulatory protein